MRNPTPFIEECAPPVRSRLGVAGEPTLTDVLAAEVIRLARLATSVHLAEQARLFADSTSGAQTPSGADDAAHHRAPPPREPVA